MMMSPFLLFQLNAISFMVSSHSRNTKRKDKTKRTHYNAAIHVLTY